MKLLKALVGFIVATLVGVLGNRFFGAFGLVVGFIAGGLAAWWVAKRLDY